MTANPHIEYKLTDTLEGEYVSVVVHGDSFDSEFKLRKTVRRVLCFKRASDGVLENALSSSLYWEGRGDRSALATSNIQLGRLRRWLQKHGTRWEFVEYQKREEHKQQVAREAAVRKAKREAAEALYSALKGLVEDPGPNARKAALAALAQADAVPPVK